ncbi:MAG: L-histidine N(alpha)-methyltransferase [Verrucomicrobiae bacterium]|nr:L-histidine N(alpha)-methyltransferase [Verrucomicrobiae bacterium]
MRFPVQVTIHPSQFPCAVQRELLKSLRTRCVNHKFHYDSVKQVEKWIAVHKTYSPWHTDPNCKAIYHAAFRCIAALVRAGVIHVIGLGCGTGQKDLQLIKCLKTKAQQVFYTPCDSSVPMVLTARQAVLGVVPPQDSSPVVCDFAAATDLYMLLDEIEQAQLGRKLARHCDHAPTRLVTFFGMIPNFEPLPAMRRLASLVRPGDFLLLSANLVPGPDLAAGMKKVLAQYDNVPTREWLMTFLLDLGVDRDDGVLRFEIERGQSRINRVVAKFRFRRNCTIRVSSETFKFAPGEGIRLFFSYRYTLEQLQELLAQHRFTLAGHWLTRSGEEAVLCARRT